MMCEHETSCMFIEHLRDIAPATTVNLVIRAYCDHDPYRCARFWLLQSFEPEEVPDHIWPHADLKALEMIEDDLRKRGKLRENRR